MSVNGSISSVNSINAPTFPAVPLYINAKMIAETGAQITSSNSPDQRNGKRQHPDCVENDAQDQIAPFVGMGY